MLPKDKGQHFESICTYWNRNKSMKGMGVERDTHYFQESNHAP